MSDSPADTALSNAVLRDIARAAEILCRAKHVTALTGAGLSVESGIPPFRGPGGLWTKYGEPPMDGYQRFLRDPAAEWRERLSPSKSWLRGLMETVAKAKPNPAHFGFAELERLGRCAALITQNIDDLHGQAGTRSLLEIHGNTKLLRCIKCVARYRSDEIAVDPNALPPLCPKCDGWLKNDTVGFGEPIPPDVLHRCYEEVERSDCMIVAGTSATVYPAAEFPYHILQRGGAVIEVNPFESELSSEATLVLRGSGSSVLTRLVERVREELRQ
jgi:NAD-dependent deacetylase